MTKAALALDLAKDFIGRNLRACCAEVVEFQTRGILGSGKVREAAIFYKEVDSRQALKMALDEVASQAMQKIAKEQK